MATLKTFLIVVTGWEVLMGFSEKRPGMIDTTHPTIHKTAPQITQAKESAMRGFLTPNIVSRLRNPGFGDEGD